MPREALRAILPIAGWSENEASAVTFTGGGDPGGNGLVAALDPAAFGDNFTFEADRLRDAIKSLPPAAGSDQPYLPGERGFEEMEKRSRAGIPLARGTVSRLLALASKLNVATPENIKSPE